MKRYDSYKDSGVEWIGEIPSRWKKLKIKHLFFHTKGKNGQKLTKEFIGNNPGEYPVYSGTTKGEGHLGKTNEYEFDTQDREVIFVSTVGSDTTVMSTKVLKGKFNLSQNCLIMTPKFDFSSRYQYYFSIHDFPYQRTVLPIVLKEGHRSVGMGQLNEFTTFLPPLSEQQQIVSFLDTKTELIDSLIEKTQRKIELLKEKRTSLINEVVTKGLNPNVEMKDSGVEWIGEIPSHWGTTRIKYTSKDDKYSFIDGDWIESKNLSDEGIRYITTGNIGEGKYKEQGKGYISEETFEELNCTEIFEGDLIISRLSLPVGRSCVLPYIHHKVVTSVDNVILRPKEEFDKYYLNYQFNSPKYFEYTELISRGVTLTRISRGMLGNNPIVFPPLNEQQQIVSYLDEQTQLIDKTISIEEKRIELLKEYRQSLISESVTGKLKVVES